MDCLTISPSAAEVRILQSVNFSFAVPAVCCDGFQPYGALLCNSLLGSLFANLFSCHVPFLRSKLIQDIISDCRDVGI